MFDFFEAIKVVSDTSMGLVALYLFLKLRSTLENLDAAIRHLDRKILVIENSIREVQVGYKPLYETTRTVM